MIRTWWNRQSRWERGGWVLVALCLLGAVTAKQVVGCASPTLAMGNVAAFQLLYDVDLVTLSSDGEADYNDEWGRPVRWRRKRISIIESPSILQLYSVGPNGRNEWGGGDDVVPTPFQQATGHWWGLSLLWQTALAGLVMWLLRGPWGKSPRAASLRAEVGRAMVLGVGVATLSLVVVFCFLRAYRHVLGLTSTDQMSWMLLTAEDATYVSVVVCAFVLALWWRLTRPLESEEPNA